MSVLYYHVSLARQEMLPALVRVMNRAVRPVAPHLFTAEERSDMVAMVDLLLAHGLTLSLGTEDKPVPHLKAGHIDMPETTPLSPPVHTLVHFQARLCTVPLRQYKGEWLTLELKHRDEQGFLSAYNILNGLQHLCKSCGGERAVLLCMTEPCGWHMSRLM